MEVGTSIEHFRISKIPDTAYYIPDFITKEEEKYLQDQVYAVPKPKWTQLAHRRLQNWGGLPHPKGMLSEKLPLWLDVYANKIAGLGLFGDFVPNHVLVNEYKPKEGIMPHEDGPLFFPVISTISLGSHTVLNYYKKNKECESTSENETSSDLQEPDMSLLLEPRSLLLVKDKLYTDYLHGIEETDEDVLTDRVANVDRTQRTFEKTLQRSTRISLTIRYVPKTLKVKLRLGKR